MGKANSNLIEFRGVGRDSVGYPGEELWFGVGAAAAGVEVFRDNEEPMAKYWLQRTIAGECLLGRMTDRLCYLGFIGRSKSATVADLKRRWPQAEEDDAAARESDEFPAIFDSKGNLCEIPRLLVRGTDLQLSVWAVLSTLPYGLYISYGQLAAIMGRLKAARAIGNAVGANSIGWIIPCHRVVRADGHLGGYRWGPAAKKRLLNLEEA